MRKTNRQKSTSQVARSIVSAGATVESRVLILAPTGNDARLTADFLVKSDFVSHICRDVKMLCEEIARGCGAILLAEEVLGESSIMGLVETLAHQPTWSDIPVVIITSGGEANQMQLRRLGLFGSAGNVSLLERPFRPGTLLSIIQSASHARRRQYEVRGLLQVVSESERRYRELVKGLPAAVYTTDAAGRINLYNEAAVKLWGREPEIGRELSNGAHRILRLDGSLMPVEEYPMTLALKERRPVRGQQIIIERPDGTRRIVVPHPDPVFNDTGELVGGVNMLLDITEAKRAEENSRRLAAIVEFSEDAIVSKDLNGIIRSWNKGAEHLFGYRPDEIIGKPVSILMSPDLWSEEARILERIRREQLEHYETVRQRKDGSKVEVSLTISPIKDADGKVIGASKIARDITGQKQAKRDLERAHKELLAASSAKDDFIAALSHELRTPLNPVLLIASEAVDDLQIPEPVREMFGQIRNNVELEARLIDDLLDITRISRGKLSLHLNQVDAHSVLKGAISTVQAEIDEKRIVLTLDLSAAQHHLKADPVRLQQVFWNILKNAVKFTPDFGKVDVETRNHANGEFELSVTDSGIGMTEPELARIFEAFAQGEHAKTSGGHRFGGLGLGLAICRSLVESHSGTIRATSKGRNQGSTFIVTLPTAKKEISGSLPSKLDGNGTGPTAKAAPNSLHILLVEDHEPTRRALAQLLARRHHDVKMAGTVAEARELFGHNDFQLLISDIGLPDGNGFDLMKKLHARNKNLRGIALTGYGMEQDIDRSEEAGFLSHLTKPIRVQSLDLILATLGDN